MTLIFNYQYAAKGCGGTSSYKISSTKLSAAVHELSCSHGDDAKNNTALASAGSNERLGCIRIVCRQQTSAALDDES